MHYLGVLTNVVYCLDCLKFLISSYALMLLFHLCFCLVNYPILYHFPVVFRWSLHRMYTNTLMYWIYTNYNVLRKNMIWCLGIKFELLPKWSLIRLPFFSSRQNVIVTSYEFGFLRVQSCNLDEQILGNFFSLFMSCVCHNNFSTLLNLAL